jgi:hypothetical protein
MMTSARLSKHKSGHWRYSQRAFAILEDFVIDASYRLGVYIPTQALRIIQDEMVETDEGGKS